MRLENVCLGPLLMVVLLSISMVATGGNFEKTRNVFRTNDHFENTISDKSFSTLARIEALVSEGYLYFPYPLLRGDRYFAYENAEEKFYTKSSNDGSWKVLLPKTTEENNKVSAGQRVIASISSRNGDLVAFAFGVHQPFLDLVTPDTFQFKNTDTEEVLDDVLQRVTNFHFSGISVAWNHESTGIYYMSDSAFPNNFTETQKESNKTVFVFYHEIGTRQVNDVLLGEIQTDEILNVQLSDDGTELVFSEEVYLSGIMRWRKTRKSATDPITYLPQKTYTIDVCKIRKSQCVRVPNVFDYDKVYKDTCDRIANYYRYNVENNKNNGTATPMNICEGKNSDVSFIDGKFVFNRVEDVKGIYVFKAGDAFTDPVVFPVEDYGASFLYFLRNTVGSKIIIRKTTLLSIHDFYELDVADPKSSLTRVPLPGYGNFVYENMIQTSWKSYKTSDGAIHPIFLVHRKEVELDATAPLLFVITSRLSSRYLQKLYLPFLELFHGVIAIIGVQDSCAQTKSCPATPEALESIKLAVQFVVKKKYSSIERMTVVPANYEFSALVAAAINQYPELFEGSLILDGISPYVWNPSVPGTTLPNVSVYDARKNSSDDYRSMPWLATFPQTMRSLRSYNSTGDLAQIEVARYVPLFSYIAETMNYEISTK